MNFILFVIALVLIFFLTIINYFVVKVKKGYFLSTATNLDIFANREFRATWNKYLRTEGGYLFGREGETISSALGKNKRDGTLTKTGIVLCNILDFLDENHCINSIR
jgi:hypothetical protein